MFPDARSLTDIYSMRPFSMHPYHFSGRTSRYSETCLNRITIHLRTSTNLADFERHTWHECCINSSFSNKVPRHDGPQAFDLPYHRSLERGHVAHSGLYRNMQVHVPVIAHAKRNIQAWAKGVIHISRPWTNSIPTHVIGCGLGMSLLQTTSLPPQQNSSSPRWASRNGLPLCKEDISHLLGHLCLLPRFLDQIQQIVSSLNDCMVESQSSPHRIAWINPKYVGG
ncbi:hypothetical protein EV126DRAFT_12928 [Verticillium dahliae]|nr:hypothetical protein EV126DRAFT_12928 [Verticillium dahliae]